MENESIILCKNCKYAKDKWNDACYCVYYGYIVSRGKTDCWGYEPREPEGEQDG